MTRFYRRTNLALYLIRFAMLAAGAIAIGKAAGL